MPDPMIRTVIARPILPAEVLTACAAPVRIPERSLSAAEFTPLWARDRAALRICEQRRAAAVSALTALKASRGPLP